jgi:hypothetical protein
MLENLSAYDDVMVNLCVQCRCPSVVDKETTTRGALPSHCDRCRTEIQTDVLLNALLQQHRGELAWPATDFQYSPDIRGPEPIRDYCPEEIIE